MRTKSVKKEITEELEQPIKDKSISASDVISNFQESFDIITNLNALRDSINSQLGSIIALQRLKDELDNNGDAITSLNIDFRYSKDGKQNLTKQDVAQYMQKYIKDNFFTIVDLIIAQELKALVSKKEDLQTSADELESVTNNLM